MPLVTFDVVNENFCDTAVRLIYESMLNKYTKSGNTSGLTLDEVRHEILKDESVTLIKVDGVIVGVANPSVLHHSLYDKLGLNRDIDYHRLGIIYFDENHRGKGYGALALKEFIKIHKNVIYITHASNDISNAIAQKHLTYYKDHYSWHNYKVYITD